jgi:hypothetical protein
MFWEETIFCAYDLGTHFILVETNKEFPEEGI